MSQRPGRHYRPPVWGRQPLSQLDRVSWSDYSRLALAHILLQATLSISAFLRVSGEHAKLRRLSMTPRPSSTLDGLTGLKAATRIPQLSAVTPGTHSAHAL